MVFIDVHNHIEFYNEEKIKQVVKDARKANVRIIVNNGVNPSANRSVLDVAGKYKEVKAALGLYPTDAMNLSSAEIKEEMSFIRDNKGKIVAIGEIGLDMKENKSLKKQEKIFIEFVKLAEELNKPVIVHSRKAEKRAIELLERIGYNKVVMHCFCGRMNLVQEILKNNWMLTIPTNVKHSEHFQKVVAMAPIENLLCETDSPFLHPDKKQDNEPAKVIESYKKIAEIKNLPLEEIERKVEENYKRVFG